MLGGFRVHGDALGESDGGEYEHEAEGVFARFAARQEPCTLRRARLVRAIGRDRRTIVAEGLHRAGLWPWYRHPRAIFDFDLGRWTIRP